MIFIFAVQYQIFQKSELVNLISRATANFSSTDGKAGTMSESVREKVPGESKSGRRATCAAEAIQRGGCSK